MKLGLVCNRSDGDVDGIRDYTVRLERALSGLFPESAWLLLREADGSWTVRRGSSETSRIEGLARALDGCSVAVLQYNPFMYGRWGFAPWLPLALLRTRLKHRPPTIVVMVHEPYVPMINWKWALMGLWQRFQLFLVRAASDVVLASIQPWADRFASKRPRHPTYHLPVGSNLPDRSSARADVRWRLGLSDALVITCFGTGPPGRLTDYVRTALEGLAAGPRRVVFLNLGAGAAKVPGVPPSVKLLEPGRLSDEGVAEMVAATDIFLAPFADGVSTRRGSLMAALQHGLAVVGTDGPLTDPMLRLSGSALRLVPIGRSDEFTKAVLELAEDETLRSNFAAEARRLYESCFGWSVIADRLVEILGERRMPEPAQSAEQPSSGALT